MVPGCEKDSISARALEFGILTAARSIEVRGATWGEIDLAARTWPIPASRMKAGREHTVPLSSRAMEILKSLPRVGELVFPGARAARDGKALVEMLFLGHPKTADEWILLAMFKKRETPHF